MIYRNNFGKDFADCFKISVLHYIRNFRVIRLFRTISILCALFMLGILMSYWTCDTVIPAVNSDFMKWSIPLVAFMMMIPDFVVKCLFMDIPISSDTFIRARPVSERASLVVLMSAAVANLWNLATPCILSALFYGVLGFSNAMVSAFVLFLSSAVNSLAVFTYHRADGFYNKFYVILIGFMWLPVLFFFCFNPLRLSWYCSMLLITVLFFSAAYVLYRYNLELTVYPETKDSSVKVLFSYVNPYFVDAVGILRTNKLKVQLFLPILFICQLYLMDSNYLPKGAILSMMPLVMTSSVLVGSFAFGLEANFFDGIWSRPCNIYKMLIHKYLFYMLLTLFYTTILFILVNDSLDIPAISYISQCLFVIGIINVVLLLSIFDSDRIDLYSTSYIDYQSSCSTLFGNSMLPAIPLAIDIAITLLIPTTLSSVIVGCIGLLGLVMSPIVIRLIARKYEHGRYSHFERYRE